LFRAGRLDDPQHLALSVRKVGHYWPPHVGNHLASP